MNNFPIHPLNGYVVVRLLDKEEKSVGGKIIVPDMVKPDVQDALVVAVGSPRLTREGLPIDPHIKVGDHVLISGDATRLELNVEGTEYLLVYSDEVCGVFTRKS